jgi:hypothetical protein
MLHEGALQLVQPPLFRQPLDGSNALALELNGEE